MSDNAEALNSIDSAALLKRMQDFVLGEDARFPEFIAGVLQLVAVDFAALPEKVQKNLLKSAKALHKKMGLDLAQVKAADVILKKRLPDLANVESTGRTNRVMLVQIPAHGLTAEQWGQQAQKFLTGNVIDAEAVPVAPET